MKKSIFFVIISLLLVAVLSNMSYEQQTLIPTLRELLQEKPLENWLSQFEFHYWGSTITVETRGYYYVIEFLIRKATHFFGYGILAVIFYFFYRKLSWRLPTVLAFLSIVIIASLDEFRQSTIPGRSGIVDDVILDACGAFTLLVCVKLFCWSSHKIKQVREVR
ncbi:VanZ family protein [Solibacillus sp. FSL H8-0523]|uniref:VanZ family protein n=1 Tax=Solibacillus sp. FSL H8-0523 TaxID=2954511 RepID=UPI003100FDEC